MKQLKKIIAFYIVKQIFSSNLTCRALLTGTLKKPIKTYAYIFFMYMF